MIPQTWTQIPVWGKLGGRGLRGRLSAITDKPALFSFLVLFEAVRPADDL